MTHDPIQLAMTKLNDAIKARDTGGPHAPDCLCDDCLEIDALRINYNALCVAYGEDE